MCVMHVVYYMYAAAATGLGLIYGREYNMLYYYYNNTTKQTVPI